jgi:hypothetical protein
MNIPKKSWTEKIKARQTKISADNWKNYWGWRFAGVMVIFAAFLLICLAIFEDATDSPEGLVLIAICLVSIGQFGLSLQNYSARVMHTIEAEEAKRQNRLDTPAGP